MKIVVAGSHGKVGQLLVNILADKGHSVQAMIRDEKQSDELKKLGANPIICDLEHDKTFPLDHIDVVIFVAGSGPDTSDDKTIAIDQKGAIKLIDGAYRSKVPRFIMLSSVGAHDPKAGPEKMYTYLKAKHEADKELKFSGLLYTILRAVQLTDEPGTGKISAAVELENRKAKISRQDVAEAIAACLEHAHTENKVFEISGGETPIHDALVNLPLVQ